MPLRSLHGVHVRPQLVRLRVGQAERLVVGLVERIGVVQRRLDAVRRVARLEHAIGQETGAVERDPSLQPGGLVVLEELRGTGCGEAREHSVGLGRGDLGEQRLELDLTTGELAALLRHVETRAVVDGGAERGESAGRGQHDADLDLVGRLGVSRRRRELRDGGGNGNGDVLQIDGWTPPIGGWMKRAVASISACG